MNCMALGGISNDPNFPKSAHPPKQSALTSEYQNHLDRKVMGAGMAVFQAPNGHTSVSDRAVVSILQQAEQTIFSLPQRSH